MPQVNNIFMFLYSETLVIIDIAVIISFIHICIWLWAYEAKSVDAL
jgi:hypothetical protein